MPELSDVEDALFQLSKRLFRTLENPASEERAATVASIEAQLREHDGSSGAVVAELRKIAQSLVNLAGRSQATTAPKAAGKTKSDTKPPKTSKNSAKSPKAEKAMASAAIGKSKAAKKKDSRRTTAYL
jgi:hypothetical protein